MTPPTPPELTAIKPRLSEADYQRAAKLLNVPVATIKAVTAVESGGTGFDKNGHCIIRFEPHIFSRRTNQRYDKTHIDISFPVRKQGYPVSVNQSWQLFKKAAALNPLAAVQSTSWGLFQIMGFHAQTCGCETTSEFVAKMEASEGEQLALFCEFIRSMGLADELQRKDWASFARSYNGAGYASNKYDTKLAAAYKRFGGV